MNEKERQNRIQSRKKKQREKELLSELDRDLKIEDQRIEQAEIRDRQNNRLWQGMIIFLGTLIPFYLFLFGVNYLFKFFFGPAFALLNINPALFEPVIHAVVLAASVYSVYRDKSVMEDILERFF